jgi:hypothetical protein
VQQRHLDGIAVRGLRCAFDHGHVDPVAPEIRFAPVDRGDPNLNLGVECREPAEAWDQPPDREGRRRRHGEDADPAPAAHAFAGEKHAVEPGSHALQQGLPIRGQLDRAMPALKQARADMLLERAYLDG